MLFERSSPPPLVSGQSDLDFGNENLLNVGAAGNDWTANDPSLSNPDVGGFIEVLAGNTDNKNSARVGDGSAGDSYTLFSITGTTNISMGLDNDAGDLFVISRNSPVGIKNRWVLDSRTGQATQQGNLDMNHIPAGYLG